MTVIQTIPAGHLEWFPYAFAVLVGLLPDGPFAVALRRGFGGRGFGRRGLGPFRLIRLARILFVLLFTTVLGPIVLVALLVFAGYWFYVNRRR
jgi:hypothetical protein